MRQFKIFIAVFLICSVFSTVSASVVEADFSGYYSAYELLEGIVEDTFNGSTQDVSVSSAVYSDGESFLYMYQVVNDSLSSLVRFTVAPLAGLDENSSMGYFGSSQPEGFLLNGVSPSWAETVDLATYPTVAFSFNTQTGGITIPAGSHSAVLFVESQSSPGSVDGHVMAGGVAFGTVIGPTETPTPEPASITLLAFGAIAISRRKKQI